MSSVRKSSLAAAVATAAVGIAGTASADVVYSLVNQTYDAFQFSLAAPAGSLTGVLTGATISVTLDQSVAYTYADDLCVYLDSGDLSPNGALQIGGYSTLFASQRYFWPTGNSNGIGTMSEGTAIPDPLEPGLARSRCTASRCPRLDRSRSSASRASPRVAAGANAHEMYRGAPRRSPSSVCGRRRSDEHSAARRKKGRREKRTHESAGQATRRPPRARTQQATE
jgi:hypothetical protein